MSLNGLKSSSNDKYAFRFDPEQIKVQLDARINYKSSVEELGEYLIFPIRLISLDIPRLTKTKNRKYPLEFLTLISKGKRDHS